LSQITKANFLASSSLPVFFAFTGFAHYDILRIWSKNESITVKAQCVARISTVMANNTPVVKKPKPLAPQKSGIRRCLACGSEDVKPGRRYCSRECRQRLQWTLSLSKGLLQTLNARYAAFSFTDHAVALDIMPTWSNMISRFIYERKSGHTPAHALKQLILEAGKEWYKMRSKRNSRSFSSQSILQENAASGVNPDSIKPTPKRIPKLSADQKRALRHLNIPMDALVFGDYAREIKRAFWGMAKIHHPDRGGDGEMFKEIKRAHESMLEWVESPRFQSNAALPGCWSYNGYRNRWSPPLRQ
jgi:hypothetical protein